MRIYCSRASDMPKCPRKALNTHYVSKQVTLRDDPGAGSPGSDCYVEILSSRSSAKAYVAELLQNGGLPLAQPQYVLDEYKNCPELYREDMAQFAADGGFVTPDDDAIYIYGNGKLYAYPDDDFHLDYAASAMNLLETVKNAEIFDHAGDWGDAVFGGYLAWESDGPGEYGMWRFSFDPCEYVEGNYADYTWHKVYNTEIMVPPWAHSVKDFLKLG